MTDTVKVYIALSPRRDSATSDSSEVRELLQRNSSHLRITPGAEVRNSSDGAPYLTGSDQHLSLTHDRYWMAAATADAPVGIDIQQHTTVSPRFLHRLRCGSVRDAVRSWCVREAVSKLRTKGLADAPWLYPLHLAPEQSSGRFEETYWHVLSARADVHLAVATHRPATLTIEETAL